MFISKKTYNKLLEDWGRAHELAQATICLNDQLIQELEEVHELNKRLQKTNEELLEKLKEKNNDQN